MSAYPFHLISLLGYLAILVTLLPAQHPAASSDAPMEEPQAPIETLTYSYGPFDLKAETLQQIPQNIGFSFPEELWLVGYSVEAVDPDGNKLPRELQCHTFIGSGTPMQHDQADVVGIFSDGYTDSIELPDGFGLLFKAGETISWTPLFNNRTPQLSRAAMRVTLRMIATRNSTKPLKELTTAVRSIQFPDLYYVEPGRDVRENIFRLPAGKIHAIGAHIHPYGVSIELINLAREESVWKAVGHRDEEGALVSMPFYKNAEGYEVRPDDRFKLVAIYENTTSRPVDAMAGMFVLYSPEP